MRQLAQDDQPITHPPRRPGTPEAPTVPGAILGLQRAAGNSAVAQLLAARCRDFQSTGEPPDHVEMATHDRQAVNLQRDPTGTATPTPTPTVAFTTAVRAATTPAAMAQDRIPPRINFPVALTVSGWAPAMGPIQISVAGSGTAAGTVTVNGGASAQVTATGVVNLQGTAQTAPGSAGGLRLLAQFGGQNIALGNPFSVAAIPQDMVLAGHVLLTGPRRGFTVTQTWSSDSGTVADLDQAQVSELVQYVISTGCFTGLGASNSGYIAAVGGTLTDTHSTPVAALTASGHRVAYQTEMFRDMRTGAANIPMRNSGFIIERVVLVQPATAGSIAVRLITTSKDGAAVTANGIASAAGAGSVSRTQNF